MYQILTQEQFTDAVLAIILTIMILEFKVPESTSLNSILSELPYLFSYAIGYLLIGVAWYNHHYMFSKTHGISKRVYWANNFWMFTTSFLPVATAWTGRGLSHRGPEIFYAIIFSFWSFAYILLTYMIADDDLKRGYSKEAADLKRMKIYRYLTNIKYLTLQVFLGVLVLFFKPELLQLIVLWQILVFGAWSNEDSDKLF